MTKVKTNSVLAHINPAVSLGFLVDGQISLIKFGLYSFLQFIGAIIGQYTASKQSTVGKGSLYFYRKKYGVQTLD